MCSAEGGHDVILVAGTSGTGTPQAALELCRWSQGYAESGESLSLLHENEFKYESVLFDVYKRATGEDHSDDPIGVLLQLAKPILVDYFRRAVQEIRSRLNGLPSPRRRVILPVHLVWHHPKQREYIGVLDSFNIADQLGPHQVSHVLCLIDDVHDCYKRLRKPGTLWDRRVAGLPPSDARRGHAFRRHTHLLEWRAREIAAAESLASRLGCPFTLLAVKHPIRVAYDCVRNRPQAYLSHPISEPRRLQASTQPKNHSLDADFRTALWDFQRELSRKIPLLQPTCIDEYRRPREQEGRLVLPQRFYPRDQYADSLYDIDHCDDDVIYDDLDRHDVPNQKETNTAIELGRAALGIIENQVTARDLRLVEQSRHLIVYRPRFNGNVSKGVDAEIRRFRELAAWRAGDLDASPGFIVILDSEQDRDKYAPRQLVEALVEAAEEWRFSVTLEKKSVADYLLKLSDETCNEINAIPATPESEAILAAVGSVLADLALGPNWTIDEFTEPEPLNQERGYTGDQGRMRAFGSWLAQRIAPFERDPRYHSDRRILIGSRTAAELAEEVLCQLQILT